MEKTVPAVIREKRRYSRVMLRRTAQLIRHGQRFAEHRIRNLSLSGLFLEGSYPVKSGDQCRLELHEQGRHSSLILHFMVRVNRIDEDGLGLVFTGMERDSFMFLQTMVLYATDDPFGVAHEFLEDFSDLALPSC